MEAPGLCPSPLNKPAAAGGLSARVSRGRAVNFKIGPVALIPLNPPAPDTLARRAAWEAPAALKFWHLASLDAPTVAVSWACAFAWAADRALPLWAAALLALL